MSLIPKYHPNNFDISLKDNHMRNSEGHDRFLRLSIIFFCCLRTFSLLLKLFWSFLYQISIILYSSNFCFCLSHSLLQWSNYFYRFIILRLSFALSISYCFKSDLLEAKDLLEPILFLELDLINLPLFFPDIFEYVDFLDFTDFIDYLNDPFDSFSLFLNGYCLILGL